MVAILPISDSSMARKRARPRWRSTRRFASVIWENFAHLAGRQAFRVVQNHDLALCVGQPVEHRGPSAGAPQPPAQPGGRRRRRSNLAADLSTCRQAEARGVDRRVALPLRAGRSSLSAASGAGPVDHNPEQPRLERGTAPKRWIPRKGPARCPGQPPRRRHGSGPSSWPSGLWRGDSARPATRRPARHLSATGL